MLQARNARNTVINSGAKHLANRSNSKLGHAISNARLEDISGDWLWLRATDDTQAKRMAALILNAELKTSRQADIDCQPIGLRFGLTKDNIDSTARKTQGDNKTDSTLSTVLLVKPNASTYRIMGSEDLTPEVIDNIIGDSMATDALMQISIETSPRINSLRDLAKVAIKEYLKSAQGRHLSIHDGLLAKDGMDRKAMFSEAMAIVEQVAKSVDAVGISAYANIGHPDDEKLLAELRTENFEDRGNSAYPDQSFNNLHWFEKPMQAPNTFRKSVSFAAKTGKRAVRKAKSLIKR